MRISSIQVRHYKSLGNVDVDLSTSPLLLVGANASGKSNIIDALRFLRDAARDGLDHAFSIRGGIDVIRQYSPTKPYKISFLVHFEQQFNEDVICFASYELKIETMGSGSYKVEYEKAVWNEEELVFAENEDEPTGEQIIERKFVRNASGAIILDSKEMKRPVQEDELSLGARLLWGPLAYPIHSFLANIRFASLYPNTLRKPSRPETDKFLKEDGENWASVLKSMKRTDRGRRSVSRIVEMMKLIFPQLEEVQVKSVGGYLVPQFLVRDTPKGKPHFFDPFHLSDGTLRVFGILLSLYQHPPASFLAIEEPEQTINPGVLGVLADAFREVSVNTQLIVTTHSPSLVDYFKVSEIKVVTMGAGETSCLPIRSSQVEAIKQKLASLGELMFLDGLQPEENS